MNKAAAAKAIIEICSRLYERNLLAAADGNVSFRISDKEILMTPTQRHKAFLKPKDLAVLTLDNKIRSGKPSSEREMHLAVYRAIPKAKCVVHAHPPTAIAWTVARPDLKELPADALSEVILAVGRIPFVPYARPGTKDMGEVIRPYLSQSRVMVLSRHGALSWGETAEEAYWGMERLEHSAQILKAAHELGGVHELPKAELDYLRQAREKMGERSL